MVIGILQLELTIDGATSLKDKRRVVRSLKDRLHREHQVSVAEVDALDSLRTAILGIVLATNDVSRCQSVLDKLIEKVRAGRDYEVTDAQTEILTGK